MILDDIIFNKRQEVVALKVALDRNKTAARARRLPGTRDFIKAISGQPAALIAETKKASPSAGLLQPRYAPAKLARRYEQGGAAAVSVLTDEKYFQGKIGDLAKVKKAVKLPVLRKDFIIDDSQLFESRLAGADAVLLIARILSGQELARFLALAKSLQMAALVETRDEADVEKALAAGAAIIGINNRDLDTLAVDLNTTVRLLDKYPELKRKVVVSESGIKTAADVARLKALGVSAILVGETLLQSPDLSAKIKELIG